jgi:hypothetical protein
MSNTTLILIFFLKKFKYSDIFFEKAHQPVLGKGGPTILFSFRKKTKMRKLKLASKIPGFSFKLAVVPLGLSCTWKKK